MTASILRLRSDCRPSPEKGPAHRTVTRRPNLREDPPNGQDSDTAASTPLLRRRLFRRGRAPCGDRGQSGFVTAEMAAALPAIVAVLALGIWAVAAVGMKVRAIDAANSAAIAAARGEDAQAVAAAYLPEGASVAVSIDGEVARARVTAPTSPLGPLTPPMSITAEAAAPMEPGLP
ncbi:TadE family type IV pilus minor pilin [Glycomyces harbinensis]|uniref:TadE-like protein n=1 Tax=Glycomyces harbinensis TaxID=58114 RepID=A0A1G7D6V9_9ACTN|nr:TadE family type IV pilus minor pilin [Glycomyces harbinensis]SDE47247.1 hypothetical protein SAMN05216270_12338 [Glycomyces harbinensis]